MQQVDQHITFTLDLDLTSALEHVATRLQNLTDVVSHLETNNIVVIVISSSRS